jgi:hypothetical protein
MNKRTEVAQVVLPVGVVVAAMDSPDPNTMPSICPGKTRLPGLDWTLTPDAGISATAD